MSPSSSSRVCIYYSKEKVLLLFSSEGENVHKHINSFGWFGSIWSQTHTHFLFCRPSFVGVPFVGVFFRGKDEKRGGKKTHLGSRFWPFEAYRYRQRTHYSKSEEYTRREREREREREGERGRKRDPTPIASTRAFERVDLVVGAAVSRREREREREFGFLLPSSFLN